MVQQSLVSGHECICTGMCSSELVRGLTFVPPVCVYICVGHMSHIADGFYLSLYVSGYNSMANAMQLSSNACI